MLANSSLPTEQRAQDRTLGVEFRRASDGYYFRPLNARPLLDHWVPVPSSLVSFAEAQLAEATQK